MTNRSTIAGFPFSNVTSLLLDCEWVPGPVIKSRPYMLPILNIYSLVGNIKMIW